MAGHLVCGFVHIGGIQRATVTPYCPQYRIKYISTPLVVSPCSRTQPDLSFVMKDLNVDRN